MAKGKNTDHDLFSIEKGSEAYQDFVNGLGWEVDLNEHIGYQGQLNPIATGNTAMYFANWECELMFHVSTMMGYLSQTYVLAGNNH